MKVSLYDLSFRVNTHLFPKNTKIRCHLGPAPFFVLIFSYFFSFGICYRFKSLLKIVKFLPSLVASLVLKWYNTHNLVQISTRYTR